MKKDLRNIKAQVEADGFTTRVTKKQHLAVYKNGQWVATFAGTPSDHRGWANSLAAISRARRQR